MERHDRAGILSKALGLIVRLYQLAISPLLRPSCRFLPSCSDYAIEALERHGALHGGGLALWRLSRCHPWGGSGYDPVPPAGSAAKSAGSPHAGAGS